MSWDDDDFERDLMTYSEIETQNEEAPKFVPETIQRYQQRIQSNNNASIFDADYSLPLSNSTNSTTDVQDNRHEKLLKDDEQVIKVVSGRGRGGRNLFQRPGVLNKIREDGDDDVIQQLRKVAPIGYGNEITEFAVRARDFQPQINEKLVISKNPHIQSSKSGNSQPVPISVLLKNSREQHKQRYLERLKNKVEHSTQVDDAELATHRKIKEILCQDQIEQKMRKKQFSDRSSSSSVTSASSTDDILPWKRKTNAPPKYCWRQENRKKELLNIESNLEFPPLK